MLFHWRVNQVIKKLNAFSEDIFTCFINKSYHKALYLFERRLHLQKVKCMKALLVLDKYNQDEEKSAINHKLNLIFLIIIDCSLLRFRVADHSTYGVCRDELISIAENINISKKQDGSALRIAISRLKDNYEQVLQVAAAQPLYFLYFIASLKSLAEAFDDLFKLLS